MSMHGSWLLTLRASVRWQSTTPSHPSQRTWQVTSTRKASGSRNSMWWRTCALRWRPRLRKNGWSFRQSYSVKGLSYIDLTELYSCVWVKYISGADGSSNNESQLRVCAWKLTIQCQSANRQSIADQCEWVVILWRDEGMSWLVISREIPKGHLERAKTLRFFKHSWGSHFLAAFPPGGNQSCCPFDWKLLPSCMVWSFQADWQISSWDWHQWSSAKIWECLEGVSGGPKRCWYLALRCRGTLWDDSGHATAVDGSGSCVGAHCGGSLGFCRHRHLLEHSANAKHATGFSRMLSFYHHQVRLMQFSCPVRDDDQNWPINGLVEIC